MNLDLTDILACPRCGPPYALILVADQVRERQVLAGWFGCSNCHARFPVREGLADFRLTPGPAQPQAAAPGEAPPEAAIRLAALMGVAPAESFRSFALVAGPAGALAPAIAAAVEGVEVVAALPGAAADHPGVSPIAVDSGLPFFDRAMRGVALTGAAADALLEEGVRVLNPMGRLVLEPPPADAAARLEAAGARVVAREGDTLVAVATAAVGG